ncbi:hypothetical protein E5K00_16455 [Hymenobacter aquaticus]|uniref:phospholipase D n=1 Tax=Hymenobacter aquaticus TaxID=1867101 RepID=A0A4Z0PX62_9BACT|nr:VWA domain-containing protein [Hymenobacter aquaticus]TGE21856.1 hypothetical protein E5K00_16455 [Hymenobacter aquaticus]
MIDSTTQLGVLTNIQNKGKNGSNYITAWIERRLPREIFLQQNKMLDKAQVAELADGRLVFFSSISRMLDKGERLDAINCSLAQPAQLQEYLLALDAPGRRQLIHRSTSAFRNVLLAQLELFLATTLTAQAETSLSDLRDELSRKDASRSEIPAASRNPQPQTITTPPLVESSSFLRHLFTSNSPAYIARLFPVLVEGIRAITDDDAFQQALLLIEVNAELAEGSKTDLTNSFYLLAAPAYRFQFWLRGLVPYCDTDVLLSELANSSEAQRTYILGRCQQNPAVLLASTTSPVSTPSVPILQAYFQNIKATLLNSLSDAQSTIQIAVAWFTHDELFTVLCEKLQQNISVELIINNDYINNWEFGLPFSKFIELGGKLYFSEHPAMMHHKFCLIDEAVLFNGSYNWTYYADLRNEENVLQVQDCSTTLASFKAEFERIKQHLGSPVTSITPFPAEEMGRFERINFREYLSKDIESRVTHTRKTRPTADPQRLVAMLNQAIEIDDRNEDARQLLKDVAPAAVIDSYAIRTQQAVRKQLTVTPQQEQLAATEPAVSKPTLPTSTPAETLPLSSSVALMPASKPIQQPPTPKPTPPQPTLVTPATITVGASLPTSTSKPAASMPARPVTSPLSTTSVITAANKPAVPLSSPPRQSVNTSISIPDTQRTTAFYKNLPLVFALDYSRSMESGVQGHEGYKLYSTGKIQQVINMIFGAAKGLTTTEKIDMFLFEQKAIQLPEVNEQNHASFVQEVVMKHTMDGTNIYAPIEAIHKKYANGSSAKAGVFVILITDGENTDAANNTKIKAHFAANHATPIFWQFVGLGAKFDFLEEVANMAPNAAFFNLNDVQTVSDDTLLERLMQKFPKWIEQVIPAK